MRTFVRLLVGALLGLALCWIVLFAAEVGGWLRFAIALVLCCVAVYVYVRVQEHDVDGEWRALP